MNAALVSNEHKRCLSKENLTWRYIKLITSPNLDANWKLNMTMTQRLEGWVRYVNVTLSWHGVLSLPKLSRLSRSLRWEVNYPAKGAVVSVAAELQFVDATSIPEGKKPTEMTKTSNVRWHALNVELQPFTNCSALLKSNHEKLLSIVEE